MKIIAIANSAGGVGKTTLAHSLAVSFAEFGKKTLLIDLDPAGDLTFRLGFENPRTSSADFLIGTNLTESNLETTSERFDFIPADARLAGEFPRNSLEIALQKLPKEYDLVVLDLPASISQLLALALSVSDLILVPVRNNLHSLRGFMQIKSCIGDLPISAVAVGPNSLIPKADLLEEVILESAEIEVASSSKFSILTTDKAGDIAESYRNVGYSILEKLGLE